MSNKVHPESEFYYADDLEFQKNSDLRATNYKQVGERKQRKQSRRD